LEPSYPVYILIGSTVKYNVFLIKQTSIEKINLPSLQYYFESQNASAADLYQLDTSGSTIVGIEIGSTEIVLIDRNMKENKLISSADKNSLKPVVPPPTALVNVVMPDVLVFTIKNWRSSWILEVGRTYEIMILIYTDKRQQIYPSENLRIEAVFDSAKFKSQFESRNGSYHILTGIQRGTTQAKASLIGTYDSNNVIQPFAYIALGQIDIELLDPIDLNPKILVFALCTTILQQQQQFTTANAYEYQTKATGGSGSYYWQSRNTTIASVNAQGIVRSTAARVGLTEILVTDTRNIDILAKSLVYVLEPIDLQILTCPVETQVNTQLYLNVKMNAFYPNKNNKVHINDCSRLQFDVTIHDEKIFKYVSVESPSKFKSIQVDDTACAIIVLDALLVGQTTIKITVTTTNEKKPSTIVQLTSNELQIGSYTALKSYKSQVVLSRGSSIQINLFNGPLYSSLSQKSSDTSSYQSKTLVSDQDLVEISQIDSEYMPNKYSYIVKCIEQNNKLDDSLVNIKISLLHKVTNYNKCPLNFDYDLKVRCARPHSIHLNQLMVFNDENGNDLSLPSSLKWKCPIKYSSNQIAAHYMRPLYIQVVVRDSLENVFDNFTSLNLEWLIQDKSLLEKSATESLSSLLVAVSRDNTGIYFFNNFNNELASLSQRIYYQTFNTQSKFGKSKILVKLDNRLQNELFINFVSDVKITPDSLTIFNHPSNVVTLNLLDGSGYYHAEIETIHTIQTTTDELTNVLKINQINENSIVVSPLVNNGLTYLHIFDYCVAPEILKTNINMLKSMPNSNQGFLTVWRPSTNAKIQVSGINLILTSYEDDKVEVKKTLKIYVQISDSNGNLIKNTYFSLMNLNGKILNSVSSSSSSTTSKSKTDETVELVTIEPAGLDEYETTKLSPKEIEFTAIYILTAIRPGIINIQFEAKSDGYQLKSDNLNMIQSQLKEIQIYVPLNVQPKYIELITGSYYQIVINGGPNSPDASITYELTNLNQDNKKTKIIEVNTDGIISALSIGQMRIDVKSVGYICPSVSTATATTKMQLRCKTEDRIRRVYSQDYLIVKVVELHSVQIIVPLKTIKIGNEMPVYLMGNEKTLTPLSFGSCNRLKYVWKINDQQIGALHHQLLSFNELDLKNIQLANKNSDDLQLFENSFVLRFAALRSGKIKISVRVELDGRHLADSVDVSVIDNAYFTHFNADYFMFKYPGLKKQLKSLSIFEKNEEEEEELLIEKYKEKSILITPGSHFQVKTNFDKSAFKINYHLSFNDFNVEDNLSDIKFNKYCNNNTVQINENGLITIAKLQQYKLKNLNLCSVNLLVTIFINEMNQQQQQNKQANLNDKSIKTNSGDLLLKKQTLLYEIKVKPISYSMLKLSKKKTSLQNTLIRLDKQSLLKNKLQLNSDGFKMQWHLKHYDDLGDLFDVVSANTRYTMNRNDLTDFSQINSNVFVYDASGNGKTTSSEKEQNDDNSDQENLKSISSSSSSSSSLSLLADSIELSFLMRTLKSGRLVMEISPFAANLFDSKDYLGITLADLGENDFIRNLDFVKRVDATIGDFICLNERMSIEDDLIMNTNNNRLEAATTTWSTLNSNVISLVSTENEYNTHYSSVGICISEGQAILKKGSTSDSSSKIVDINVKSIDKIKFVTSRSAKYITNVPSTSLAALNIIDSSFNMVQFQTNLNIQSIQNQNCSDLFEKISLKIKDQIPLKCSASLFSKSGQRLTYLDRLVKTNLIFTNRNWFCDISFVPESPSILYDLIDANQKRSATNSVNENEPVSIKVIVDTKDSLTDIESINELKSYQLPFLPAYYVQTKQIQLPITRNAFYVQALKIKNQKEYSLNEHFNLIIYSTQQLYSYLVLTTNCPSLIQIKPLFISKAATTQTNSEFDSAVLKITYDIVTADDLFDLNSYASILQEQNGNLYVQITCSLTQQIERVPIKFQFGVGDSSIEFNTIPTKSKTSSLHHTSLFSWMFELTPNEITTFAVMMTLLFITILFFMRTKQQTITQQTAEQMASVAAATANAMRKVGGSGVKEHSSFNPYRYFTSFLDTGSSAVVYSRDPRLNISGSSLNTSSPSNFSYIHTSPMQSGGGSPLKRTPQKQSYMSNYQLLNTTQSSSPLVNQSLFRSSRFSPASSTGEQVRLFSVDSDVANTSNMYENRYHTEDNY